LFVFIVGHPLRLYRITNYNSSTRYSFIILKDYAKIRLSRLSLEEALMLKLKAAYNGVIDFFLRFRFPCTLPSEIGESLGIQLPRYLTFNEFIKSICQCNPTKLYKFMPREKAESYFSTAQRKEQFLGNSLFSYYFNEGWIEFVLHFDDLSRLRRIYIHHKSIEQDEGVELPLF